MRIQGSAGRHSTRDMRDWCYKLSITADHPSPASREMEGELLARLYREFRGGNAGYWLGLLRKAQAKDDAMIKRTLKKPTMREKQGVQGS